MRAGHRVHPVRVMPQVEVFGVEKIDFEINLPMLAVPDARRCDRCDYLTGDPLVKSCPECGADLVTQRVIRLTGVRAGGGNITGWSRETGYWLSAMILAGVVGSAMTADLVDGDRRGTAFALTLGGALHRLVRDHDGDDD